MTSSRTAFDLSADQRWGHLEIDPNLCTLPQALMQAAAKWPTNPAFHYVDQDIVETYAELTDRVLRVAAGLDDLGVRPGDRVGIILSNVPEFPAAWLGIHSVGAVAVPMNPKYTAREVEFIADDTGLSAAIVAAEQLPVIEQLPATTTLTGNRIVVVGDAPAGLGSAVSWADLVDREPLAEPYALGSPEDLANIQYTSGSTGQPKGCMLTHEYWIIIGRTAAALHETPITNVLADHPFFYLQNQSYFSNAVAVGAQLHVTHGLSLSRFLDWLHEYNIDSGWVSEALLTKPPTPRDATHSLRYVPTDAIEPARHAELEKRFNMVVREWYASTEIGLGTISPWDRLDAVGTGTIGYPAPLRETKVIDENLIEVPTGEVGELCVRGPGMMRGYWNRPEVNAELFIDGGWFRTGDLVRIDEDGQHYFVGRAKDMVRRSGENIASAEVEQQLATHPAVADVAVIPVPDEHRGEEIKAVVVVHDGTTVAPAELADWCRQRLAAYKIPRYVAFSEALPYTPSGKVSKGELKAERSDLREGAYDLVDEVQR